MQVLKGNKYPIYQIRNERVMLDKDLAALYEVETRALKQAVKRNADRFADDFMFLLSDTEVNEMVSQNVIPPKSYFGGALPYAFTEQGVAMQSSVLKTKKALAVNIAIMRTFVEVRKLIQKDDFYADKLQNLRSELLQRISEHDAQLKHIYDAIEDLLDKDADKKLAQQNWNNRERIGFKK